MGSGADVGFRQQLESLHSISVEVSRLHELPQVLDRALGYCLELTGSEFGFVGLLNAGREMLEVAAIKGFEPSDPTFYERYRHIPVRPTIFSVVIREGRACISNDVVNDPRRVGQPPGHPPVRTFLGVPLRVGDEIIGMVGVANRKSGYSDEEDRLLSTFANQAAVAIDNARLYEAQKDLIRRLELLHHEQSRQQQQAGIAELGWRALVGTAPQELMEHAVALVASTLNVDYVRILELLPDGKNLLLRAGTGWRPGLVGTATVRLDNTQVGYMFESNEPLIIEDFQTDTRFKAAWLLREHSVRSGIRAVIHGSPTPFGELAAYTTKRRLFTQDDVLFMRATANTLAESFIRLHAEQEKEESLRQLREVDEARRHLLERLSLVVEEERKRIASDIHDDALQVLAGLGMRLQVMAEGPYDPAEKQSLRDLSSALAVAGDRLRRLIFDLRPDALELGLAPALRFYFEQTTTGVDPELAIDSQLTRELPADTRLMVYRACQEALNNVRKHARARHATVRVREAEGGTEVLIRDDGVGFEVPADTTPGHIGLVAMKERIQLAGGRTVITSKPGRGTTVKFWVPPRRAG
ncbi:GAF domain-containing protein [bacterium]|nr:MAG: GAF domain-containing protein [bacterium]